MKGKHTTRAFGTLPELDAAGDDRPGTREEKEMFEVTELATEKIREFFKSRDGVTPMRIFIAGTG